jgi:RimJ/RimL family protein N-acetyltransferase
MKLEERNIRIRVWKKEDEILYRFWNTGSHLWMNYDGPYYPKMTEEEVESTFKRFNNNSLSSNRMVIADKETDELLGTVSWYWQSEESNWKSIGLTIYDETSWSKGIGYNSLKFWINHLFIEDKNLTRLDLRTWSGNIGMIKLSQKLGFREEARFRNARIVDGKYYDSIGMGILREEWFYCCKKL